MPAPSTSGTLPAGVTIVAGANNTGDVTLQGPVNLINSVLNTSFYVPKANVNGTNIDTVTVTATDQGTPPLSRQQIGRHQCRADQRCPLGFLQPQPGGGADR